MIKSKAFIVLISFGLIILFLGCGKKVTIKPETTTSDVKDTISEEEPVSHFIDWQSVPQLKIVNFDFDKYDLGSAARKILLENSKYVKKHPELTILIEGHCCACGSDGYNLALGQKRAAAVKNYYIKSGIPQNRIKTISYGEKKIININAGPPDSLKCIANRRAETKIKTK